MNYGKFVSNKSTPQSEPIFGENQVPNNAGGYAYAADSKTMLDRFLMLGSEGDTYYVSESKLTQDNAKSIIELIKKDGPNTVRYVASVIKERRFPKIDPSLFVLALAATYGDEFTKAITYSVIPEVLTTSTHLFSLLGMLKELRGWSRGLRGAVSRFYNKFTPERLAYQLVKYRQRNGYTHQDALRLSHAKPGDGLQDLFAYAVKSDKPTLNLPSIVVAFEKVMNYKTALLTSKEVAGLINEFKLTWEMVPTELLVDKSILEALLPNMPMTALLRNLNRFTAAGMFDSRTSDTTKYVVNKFTDSESLKFSGLHPITILNAMHVYSQGRGDLGSLTWTPNQAIVDALSEAFELSFKTLIPSGKNILVAVDVSGSMTNTRISKMALTPQEASAALMLTMLRSEPNIEVMYFNSHAEEPTVGKRSSYQEALKDTRRNGSTNCAVPYEYALAKGLKLDAIITLTDSETWIGDKHPVQAFKSYQKSLSPSCKAVVVGMVANGVSLFDAADPSALNIAGFDSNIHGLINNFIK